MFHERQQIGSYTLINKLGKGGFGEVWLAEKRSKFVTKKVAVKLPLDEQVDFNAIRQEAELWEQASGHANVLPIIDADVIDGQVVIVSEYADGGSLADKLKREGKLSVNQAIEMTIGILNGLDFLHNKKIIHRDIKPQNILLQGNTPRLADFGISRAMQTNEISSTIVGTDAYMSPESFRGIRTVETDIWSVGVVLYYLLNGHLPFPKEHPSERMYSILQEDFEPLSKDIPQNLCKIVYKALAKLPENRYHNVCKMRKDLQLIFQERINSIVYLRDYKNKDSVPITNITIDLNNEDPYKDKELETKTQLKEKKLFRKNLDTKLNNPVSTNFYLHYYSNLRELTLQITGKNTYSAQGNLEILKDFLNKSIYDFNKKLLTSREYSGQGIFEGYKGRFSFRFGLTREEFLHEFELYKKK